MLALAPLLMPVLKPASEFVADKVSGSSGAVSCPNQDSAEKVLFVLNKLNASERDTLSARLMATKPDWYHGQFDSLFAMPVKLAFAIAGGSDCKVSTQTGRDLVAFWGQMVSKYYGMIGSTAPIVSPVVPGGSYSNLPTQYGGPTGANPNFDQGPKLDEGSAFRGALRDVVEGVKTTIEQVVSGAVAGARNSSQAAAHAATETTTTQATAGQISARYGLGFDMTTLLVFAVAGVALYLAFRD